VPVYFTSLANQIRGNIVNQSKKKESPDTKENMEKIRALAKKWGNRTVRFGWTAIPNLLLERQQALKLDAVDLNILLVLMKHWWEEDRLPYPSKRKIAETIGRDGSTVQKHIRKMEEAGLLERKVRKYSATGSQTSNEYDLKGLITALDKLSEAEMKERTSRKEEDARKRRGHIKPDEGISIT
jgi:DNA-binding MarR family transcriptional regulator